ncbi:Polypeptide N-acetylgalactosaminyltransferase 10 [Thelohanellus kitauei]|uniref:Polypeptide N-acetylgalactosaminyltransferase n=1 Tax=Thelohanellus kitauei TaxID=669202 RepID=A0A0C2IF63_THEKT|nr:Polypeptide N-acetylgalactosaminyltransferase 10 [Thelohanellus kitauei]
MPKNQVNIYPYDPNAASVGDFGLAVYYDSNEDELVKESYTLYGFNQFVSDKIGVSRQLSDVRHRQCKNFKYPDFQVKVSVIIVFYDEGWSTLWRTVTSVLNTSPQNSIKEVILVDDHSTMAHLEQPLDDYVALFNGLVKVVRSPAHEGLISARILGANAATGDYLVFLDSHCEATIGWLEPLIFPIINDYRTVTCPTIDIIDHNTFEYRIYGDMHGSTARGTFSWQFYYKERQLNEEQKRERKSIVDPVPSPVMAGGLFAISKKWWKILGGYDPGLFAWGGEQYELSFKVWMCQGSMYNIPCSHIGHVYRGPGLIRKDQGIHRRHPNSLHVNYKRVAEVWMDDYKYFLYSKMPQIASARNWDYGIEDIKMLRIHLGCKTFKWYLENVVNDTLYTAYEPDRAWNVIKNQKTEHCLNYNPSKLESCSFSTKFRWTWINEIRDDEKCITSENNGVKLDWCHEKQKNQHFIFHSTSKHIYSTYQKLCLSSDADNNVFLKECENDNDYQKWIVEWKDLSNVEPWSVWALHPPRKP